MLLNEFLTAVDNQIVEGGDSSYEFLPKNSRFVDAETKYGYATCHYEPMTCEVFAITTSDLLDRNNDYSWINPEYNAVFNEFIKQRKLEFPDAFPYTQTEDESDILDKVSAILNNRKFDPDVVVNFEIEENVEEILEKMALERNITFDKLIEEAIVKYVVETNAKSS